MEQASKTRRIFERLSGYHRSIALILLNTVFLIVFINVICYIGLRVVESRNPVWWKYGQSHWQALYPHQTEDQTNEMLIEMWSKLKLQYEPFSQFREISFKGKYVNVTEPGFRRSINQGAWPPETDKLNIFVFGGSTTFGYGVPDGDTIPSFLQKNLEQKLARPVRVYNFGRGSYYSSQELVLFIRLLTAGTLPDVAVFIDGINDFHYYDDRPEFTGKLSAAMNHTLRDGLFESLPLIRVLAELAPSERHRNQRPGADVEEVVSRYLVNKKMIEGLGKLHRVRTVFVWQPSPAYRYDSTHHLFPGKRVEEHRRHGGYPYMAKLLETRSLGDNFLWLADIQENLHEPLYVDQLHYTAKLSKIMAERIAGELVARRLLAPTAID